MKYYEQLIDERVFGYPALAEIISEIQINFLINAVYIWEKANAIFQVQ